MQLRMWGFGVFRVLGRLGWRVLRLALGLGLGYDQGVHAGQGAAEVCVWEEMDESQ